MVRVPSIVTALLVMLLPKPACSQNYGFSVPEFDCRVTVNADRSLSIDYGILFHCDIGRSSIDIVDIGFPTDDYLLSSVTAAIDGEKLYRIIPSQYIETGVEVHLGIRAIGQGTSGLFTCSGVNPSMVFLDSEKEGYASVEFSTTWFDGGILSGESDFRLEMVFPPGAVPEDVYYHGRSFTDSFVDDSGRVVYVWEDTRRMDSGYRVGISFPSDLVEGPLRERPKKPFLSPEAISTIIALFVIFMVSASIVLVVVLSVMKARRRREQYLPPTIGLEGSSIRRGLTAPMAALLLEEKLDRVFLLIVFGMVKKGVLGLEGGSLVKTGPAEGLRSYEKALLEIIPEKGRVPREGVMKVFTDMIEELEEKMEGYSLKETREYYLSVIRSAWRMVQSDESAERIGRRLGDTFQWLLADGDFESRVRDLPEGRTVYFPSFMSGLFSGSAGGKGGMSLSRACSEVAGFLESAAGRMVSNLTGMSRAVTASTNPVPVGSSSYRGSSGSSCACACACAGCACACAGGGR